MPTRIAIFASGNGSNAQNLISFFNRQSIKVVVVLCDRADAFVLQRAASFQVPSVIFSNNEMHDGALLNLLKKYQVNLIVLAGFLKLLPASFVMNYPDRIINIHPALLPKYGGKGMYGMHVHKAVHAAKEKITGVTVHYVNEHYDRGAVILQKEVALELDDTPETIAKKIAVLEMTYFPIAIKQVINQMNDDK